jgi:carbamate kinase
VRVVVGLGGNALLRRGEPLTHEVQRRNVIRAVEALADVAREHDLVITHGNGPQVGLLAILDQAVPGSGGFPLDVLNAETEGMIGYLLAQELRNELPGRRVATVLTQVEVDPKDPAFGEPTKPVGPFYTREQAQELAGSRGWRVEADGDGYRRVVPSPAPLRLLEIDTIRLLVGAGTVVVCAGGGGIPVVFDGWGRAHGVEAVVDKDRAAALVAEELGAEALLLLTDVEGIYEDWDTPDRRLLTEVTPDALVALDLADGSMGPKAAAAADFAERTGGLAAVGAIEDATAILSGRAGTRVVPR